MSLRSARNLVIVIKRLCYANVTITTDLHAHSLPGREKQAPEAFAKAMEGD